MSRLQGPLCFRLVPRPEDPRAESEERGRGADRDPDGPRLVCLTFPGQVFVVALCLIWKMTSLQKSRNTVIQTPC